MANIIENTPGTPLCKVSELKKNNAKEVRVSSADGEVSIVIVSYKTQIYAFHNSCPHTGVPLNMFGDIFFDRSGNYLLCTSHGAHFHPDDGYCTSGPCRGKSLKRFPVIVIKDHVVIAEENQK
jgi:nitrite reductase/ring-hydroxylating ferredoxin subunit